ncbi:MAG: shikimate kinase [Methanoregula sp. PtaU1.Bin051]|nr:MAG: shikimate kinase [Methanoregula sp. PtaU1.Bin051]
MKKPAGNIVLIGMPGAGKSAVGPLLAEALHMEFADTDVGIRKDTGRPLQEIIDSDGPAAFMAIEERIVLSRQYKNTVIATGGSVIFSERAMGHLKSGGVVVYLKVPFDEMERRLKDAATRGIVLFPGQGLREMYGQRAPLYEKYADIVIDCPDTDFKSVVAKVIEKL